MKEIRYTRGTSADYDAIVDFGNFVFSQSHEPHDFQVLLPKLYAPGVDTCACHYLAKEGEKIVGMVGVFPMTLNVMGVSLSVRGIGTVSAHPYYRGRGIMTELLTRTVADMKHDGTVLCVLGGKRQRYEHFGFEPCGVGVDFYVPRGNLCALPSSGADLKLEPLDSTFTEQACALSQSGALFVSRSQENFSAVCRSWNSTPLVLTKGGVFCGYLICSADRRSLHEVNLTDGAALTDALAAYLDWSGRDDVFCRLPLFEREKVAALDACCESCTVSHVDNFQIFDWETVLRQFLALKAACGPLPDGRLVLEVSGEGCFALEVRSGRSSVERTKEPADASFDRLTAMRRLFSPEGSYLLPALPGGTAAWFPLPLHYPRPDCV